MVRFLVDRGFVLGPEEVFFLAAPQDSMHTDVAGLDRLGVLHPRLLVVVMVMAMDASEVS